MGYWIADSNCWWHALSGLAEGSVVCITSPFCPGLRIETWGTRRWFDPQAIMLREMNSFYLLRLSSAARKRVPLFV